MKHFPVFLHPSEAVPTPLFQFGIFIAFLDFSPDKIPTQIPSTFDTRTLSPFNCLPDAQIGKTYHRVWFCSTFSWYLGTTEP